MFSQDELNTILSGFDGEMGLFIKNLGTGEEFEHEADVPFPTASVIKLPLLAAVFKKIYAGVLSLDHRYRLQDIYSRIFATGFFRYLQDEPEISLRDYIWFMIATSDDVATDFIFDLIGFDYVNDLLKELGCSNTRASFHMGDWQYNMVGMDGYPQNRMNDEIAREKYITASREGNQPDALAWHKTLENNAASARDMGIILEGLFKNRIVKPDASRQMLDILKQSLNRSMIPRYLDSNVQVAHKYGGSWGIKNDVGIVYFKSAPVVISAFTLTKRTTGEGGDLIAQISRSVARKMSPESITAQ